MLRIPYPVIIKFITSPFGPRAGKFHNGVDFPVPFYTDIHLPNARGRVVVVRYDEDGYGHYIIIEFEKLGICMLFAHLSARHGVKVGQITEAGEILKNMTGNSGYSNGPHLHVEIHNCLYGAHFWKTDTAVPYKKLYSMNPMWFFAEDLENATEVRAESMTDPEGWESFRDALLTIADFAEYFDEYTMKAYNKGKE